MTPEQFCYWLQGYAETHTSDSTWQPSCREWKIILDHLNTVFKKVTPSYNLPMYINQPFTREVIC